MLSRLSAVGVLVLLLLWTTSRFCVLSRAYLPSGRVLILRLYSLTACFCPLPLVSMLGMIVFFRFTAFYSLCFVLMNKLFLLAAFDDIFVASINQPTHLPWLVVHFSRQIVLLGAYILLLPFCCCCCFGCVVGFVCQRRTRGRYGRWPPAKRPRGWQGGEGGRVVPSKQCLAKTQSEYSYSTRDFFLFFCFFLEDMSLFVVCRAILGRFWCACAAMLC